MPRTRLINPNAPMDEDVATMSLAARYAWAYLPCHADREGRLRDSSFFLRTSIFPNEVVDMEAIVVELEARRHIERYEVDGRRYIQIRNFKKYQSPHRNEVASVIPVPGVVEIEKTKPSWVYFIQNMVTGLIKIGHSRMVKDRLSNLQIGSADRLSLLGVTPGGREKERALHERFSSQREGGEWFRRSDELLDLIESECLGELPERAGVGTDGLGTETDIARTAPSCSDPVLLPSDSPVSLGNPDQTRSEPCAKDAVVGLVPNWERYKMPFDVTPTFSEVFAKYPNQVGQAKAASAWCAIVEAGYPGGEPALSQVVVARFAAGQLARHPYSGDSKYRPSFETYLREFRWLDADSAPDPTPEAKAQPENFAQRDARAAREAAERTQRSLDRDVANTSATLTTCPVHLYGPREDRKCNRRCPMWEGPASPDSSIRTLAETKAVARG